MVRVLIVLVMLSAAALQAQAGGQAGSAPASTPPSGGEPRTGTDGPAPALPANWTDAEKTIYALGLLMQRSIRQFDLSAAEIDILKQALLDAGAGRPGLKLDEWGPLIAPFANERSIRATAREKAASAAYLEQAAAYIGAVKTPSGLVYRDITVGTGPSPRADDSVRVHYRGTLINGTEFDSSYGRSEPATFPLSGVVPCWTEGMQRMKVGGKARLVCPSELAYGDGGSPAIPGGAALVFEIELVEVVPSPLGRPLN